MKTAAIFDLDETIYHGYSLKDLAKFLFSKGKINRFFLIKVFYWMILKKNNLLNDEKALTESLTLFKGTDVTELKSLIKECFNLEMKNTISKKVIEIINDHKKSSHWLILATESFNQLAIEFANYLGFDHVISTNIDVIDGKLTGKLNGPVCMKQEKARQIKEFCQKKDIDLTNSYSYGGRIDDQFQLELSKNAIMINPDPPAKKLAQQKNWQIINLN